MKGAFTDWALARAMRQHTAKFPELSDGPSRYRSAFPRPGRIGFLLTSRIGFRMSIP